MRRIDPSPLRQFREILESGNCAKICPRAGTCAAMHPTGTYLPLLTFADGTWSCADPQQWQEMVERETARRIDLAIQTRLEELGVNEQPEIFHIFPPAGAETSEQDRAA